MLVASSERVAGLGFLTFVLLQVPFFAVHTPVTRTGVAVLAPLQVAAAKVAKTYPQAHSYAQMALLPGAWTSFSLFPYIRCLSKTGLKGPCAEERARLWDPPYTKEKANLQLLTEIVYGPDFREGQAIEYGCALIVVSAAFSLFFSVKTAVVGFIILGYGIFKGNHDAMPPFVMTAFLCVYAGFQLGETKERLRERERQRQLAAAMKKDVKPEPEPAVEPSKWNPEKASTSKAAASKRTSARRRA